MIDKNEQNCKKNKKFFISFLFIIIAFLIPITSILSLFYSNINPYKNTFYAALVPLSEKLDKNKNEKKIIILGTSSVVFSLDSALLEKELENAGINYKVNGYGLYGALGIKLMMELCYQDIQKDDIVLFSPEYSKQTMSSYFSALETLKALENNKSYLNRLDDDDLKKVLLNISNYSALKFQNKDKIFDGSGVYKLSSFDNNMDFKNEFLKENIMQNYHDENNIIDLNSIPFESSFISYVNEYAKKVKNKGANFFYYYSPMNRKSIKELNIESLNSYSKYVDDTFEFEQFNIPIDGVYEENWFYDTDYHLNSIGMIHSTLKLSDCIKNYFDNTIPNLTKDPDLPFLNTDDNIDYLDNTDINSFIYREDEKTVEIIGLSEEGKTKSDLIVPSTFHDKKIISIENNALHNLTNLKTITIQSNIKRLKDRMFEGCNNLKEVHLQIANPSSISVGFNLFTENQTFEIYVPNGNFGSYISDYSWSYYSKYLKEESK